MLQDPGATSASPSGPVLVVGAGWAGLTAAVRLAQARVPVSLIDASRAMGGRARSQALQLGDARLPLDNGQHLLIGAYHRVLALQQTVGAAPDSLRRRRLFMDSTTGLHLRTDRWPGHAGLIQGLLSARGLSWAERYAMVRLILRLPPDQARHWPAALTVAQWLTLRRQPPRLIERVWRPLCVGALNTPIDQACARTFARVLRDSFRGAASDSDLLIPERPLGEVLPEPAHRWLLSRGVQIRGASSVRALTRHARSGWTVRLDDQQTLQASQIILATPAPQTARILQNSGTALALADTLASIRYTPIATVWLGWRVSLALPAMIALNETEQSPGQWLFDRGDALRTPSRPTRPLGSLASVVVSAPGTQWPDPAPLQAAVIRQVCAELSLPEPDVVRTVTERRATPACTPDRPRIDTDALKTLAPGLWLAGDWVWHQYPGTLEGAVRSGEAAAQHAIEAHAQALSQA